MSEAAALVVGVDDIPQKEQLVLRSLLRLLDGRLGPRLVFSEILRDCHVVFARQGVPQERPLRPTVVVRVLAENVDAQGSVPDGLSIQAPLRMTNVMEALRACVDVIKTRRADAASSEWPCLVEVLAGRPIASARPCEAYALDGHGRLLIDFRHDRVHTTAPAQALIDGKVELTPARWNATQEEEARRTLPAYRLRELLWSAAHRLGKDERPVDALHGSFRLLRWPDAAALRHPGFPRLAALLTSRSFDVAGACEASGISRAGVHWFLKVALALGIAESVEEPEPIAGQAAVPNAPSQAARSIINRLRERLKLW